MLPRGSELCQFTRAGLPFQLQVVTECAIEPGLEEGHVKRHRRLLCAPDC